VHTIPQTQAQAADAVQAIPCPYCRSRPGSDCAVTGPPGMHFARWAAARRLGLISEAHVGAALDSILVITDGALVLAAVTP
jgi:hypothetical protein